MRRPSGLLRFFLDPLVYQWKRNLWLLDPRSHLGDRREIPIDRPIFLLGVQGGGLTLVSRMLRRHPAMVSVTGNCRYWSGADEMHTVLGPALPEPLAGTRFKVPVPGHPLFVPPRSWTYACDELLPHYRRTAADASAALKSSFQILLRRTIARHALHPLSSRFTDKSQVYTVRLALIRELLKECRPKFVLILVNPYTACAKAAAGKAVDMKQLLGKLSFEKRLEICSQHWANSMRCALEDDGSGLLIVRLEDILAEPRGHLQHICRGVELEFFPGMLPQPGQRLPLGSRFPDKWYPLDPERNRSFARSLDPRAIAIIERRCGELASHYGYAPDGSNN
jgi:hypothetical protein